VLLATPFRLFFLLATGLAAVWIPAWVVVFTRSMPLSTNLGAIGWHAHEMVFGYTGAVLAGFLLTATRNWTNRATLAGIPLLLLAGCWAFGRVAALHSASLPGWLPIAVDGAFWLALAAAIAVPILTVRSWRNVWFPLLLLIIGAADVCVHLHVVGKVSPMWSARAMQVGLDAIALIIFIFGGRILPLFTGNAIAEVTPRAKGWLDWLGLGAMTALLCAHVLADPNRLIAGLAIAAGVVNFSRLWGWGGSRTLRAPILWVLYAGWALLSISLIVLGVSSAITEVPPGVATHLFTVGGIGVTTMGMMARVSLGHTGRPLRVPFSVALAFGLMLGVTLVRAIVPWAWPSLQLRAVQVSGIGWATAFAIFAARYVPMWLSPRADGKPG